MIWQDNLAGEAFSNTSKTTELRNAKTDVFLIQVKDMKPKGEETSGTRVQPHTSDCDRITLRIMTLTEYPVLIIKCSHY